MKKNPASGLEKALEYCTKGIEQIITFYKEYGITSEIDNSIELSILNALKSEFLKNIPETLEMKLQEAIKEERFEDAAKILDMINTRRKEK